MDSNATRESWRALAIAKASCSTTWMWMAGDSVGRRDGQVLLALVAR